MPIKRASTISKALAESIDSSRSSERWLNPIAMSHLKVAVLAKKKEVTLNGINYSITYGFHRVGAASGEDLESIRLNRTDGQFVPMGYVSMKKIREFDFEASE